MKTVLLGAFCAFTMLAQRQLTVTTLPSPCGIAGGQIFLQAGAGGSAVLTVQTCQGDGTWKAGATTDQLPAMPLSVANGGTGTTTPSGLSGSSAVKVTGTFPNQTVAMSVGNGLPKFRLAASKTKDGASDTKILFVGDSTTEGIGSTDTSYVNLGSYPTRVISTLPRAAGGLATYNVIDGRWTFPGVAWIVGNGYGFCQGGNNAGALIGSTAANSLVFTPGAAAGMYDSFDVYLLNYPGNGTYSMTATGGSAVTGSTNATAGPIKVTVTAGSASTGNAISITGTSSGNVFLLGIEPYLSTQKRIRVGNIGISGSTSGQCGQGGGPLNSIAAISYYAPDLTFISLGINDAGTSTSGSTLSTNIQAIITAAQISGDVVLMTMPPSQNATPFGFESTQYVPAYYSLAQTNNIPLIDIFARFGGAFNSTYMNSDGLHPNNLGYWDWAAAVQALLNLYI